MSLVKERYKNCVFLVTCFLSFSVMATETLEEKTKKLEKFLNEKIVELIAVDENYNLQNQDIEVTIETKKIKKIPDSIDEIEDIELINVNRFNNSFKADIKINNGSDDYYHQEIQGKYREMVHVPVLKKRMQTGYIIEHDDIEHSDTQHKQSSA